MLMPEAVRKTKVDGWAEEERLAMLSDVGRRSVEFEGVWLGVQIVLQLIGEVTVYFAAFKNTKT